MISCAHCSTTVEDYATVCPGCGAEKVRSYESFFSWSTMIWGVLISLVLNVIIDLIFDLSDLTALLLLAGFIGVTFLSARNNTRYQDTWYR
jgi:hypothetical protein